MFDPVLLRTFVAVAETLSFTRAAEQLQLSQPTVSQQVRKLEIAAGRCSCRATPARCALTDNGDAMLGFARTILVRPRRGRVATSSDPRCAGGCGSASADDLALTAAAADPARLPAAVPADQPRAHGQPERRAGPTTACRAARPRVREAGAGSARGTHLVRRERLVWVAHKSLQLDAAQPVPLIVYQAPSLSRTAAIKALEDVGPHLAHHLQRARGQRGDGGAARRDRRGGVPART